jgi:hypothetical protein
MGDHRSPEIRLQVSELSKLLPEIDKEATPNLTCEETYTA